jgi:hypothetical protein
MVFEIFSVKLSMEFLKIKKIKNNNFTSIK